jgi:hypothetical protein
VEVWFTAPPPQAVCLRCRAVPNQSALCSSRHPEDDGGRLDGKAPTKRSSLCAHTQLATHCTLRRVAGLMAAPRDNALSCARCVLVRSTSPTEVVLSHQRSIVLPRPSSEFQGFEAGIPDSNHLRFSNVYCLLKVHPVCWHHDVPVPRIHSLMLKCARPATCLQKRSLNSGFAKENMTGVQHVSFPQRRAEDLHGKGTMTERPLTQNSPRAGSETPPRRKADKRTILSLRRLCYHFPG